MDIEFDFDFSSEGKPTEQKTIAVSEKTELKIRDIFTIESDGMEIIDTISVFDNSRVPILSSTPKHELYAMLQPHSIDIAILSPSKDTVINELNALEEIMCYQSTIYILDLHGCYSDKVRSCLSRQKYTQSSSIEFLGSNLYAFYKGEQLFVDCFNQLFNIKMFNAIVPMAIDIGSILLTDCKILVDAFKTSILLEKNMVFVGDIEDIKLFYEEEKQEIVKVNTDFQIEMF